MTKNSTKYKLADYRALYILILFVLKNIGNVYTLLLSRPASIDAEVM